MKVKPSRHVLWIDDDPALLTAEKFDLEDLGISSLTFWQIGKALDWIYDDLSRACTYDAVIVDALMPSYEDPRFRSDDATPAGLLLCGRLAGEPKLEALKGKLVLYSRLPQGGRLQLIQSQAAALGVPFFKKSRSSRIALELMREGLIQDGGRGSMASSHG